MAKDEIPLPELLICGDWSQCTVDDIAEQTGRAKSTVQGTIFKLRQQGIEIPFRHKRSGRKPKPAPEPKPPRMYGMAPPPKRICYRKGDPCSGCIHTTYCGGPRLACVYVTDTGHRRPCPSGAGCTVKETLKQRREKHE